MVNGAQGVERRRSAAYGASRGAGAPGDQKMERETGFEPATSTLARSHSTTELFPPCQTPTVYTIGSSRRNTGFGFGILSSGGSEVPSRSGLGSRRFRRFAFAGSGLGVGPRQLGRRMAWWTLIVSVESSWRSEGARTWPMCGHRLSRYVTGLRAPAYGGVVGIVYGASASPNEPRSLGPELYWLDRPVSSG